MGKTYKDIKKFDVKRHKEIAREFTKELDMRTRVKPVEKREKGGAKNRTRDILEEASAPDEEDEDYLEHFGD